MPFSRIFIVANMSFNAIRENKILAKISEFTVIKNSVAELFQGHVPHILAELSKAVPL